jgi:hypothetical protein
MNECLDLHEVTGSERFVLLHLQHPFVANVSSKKPIQDLISEAKAEVIVEEKDIDDSEVPVSIDIDAP